MLRKECPKKPFSADLLIRLPTLVQAPPDLPPLIVYAGEFYGSFRHRHILQEAFEGLPSQHASHIMSSEMPPKATGAGNLASSPGWLQHSHSFVILLLPRRIDDGAHVRVSFGFYICAESLQSPSNFFSTSDCRLYR
jgi:hypothetical protein